MFAFPTEAPTVTGVLNDSAGKPIANKAVSLVAGGKTFKTFTDGKGNYRFYQAPAGQGKVTVA
jgi:hypothetical protein